MSRTLRLRWARKLTKAKYFVVLTDKESVISLEGVSPENLHDVLALQSQAAALHDFQERLGDIIRAHEKVLEKMVAQDKPKKRKPAARRKKITVREG